MRPTHRIFLATGGLPLLSAPLACGLALIFFGCASNKPVTSSDPSTAMKLSQSDFGAQFDRSRCDDKGKQAVTLDANGDGKPDVIKIFQASGSGGQQAQQLVCKQTDLDFDGKIDLVQYYGPAGDVVMDEYSLNYSGKFNGRTFFQEGKKVRAEKDMNFDGRPDYFEIYEGGRLVRIERDSNADGRVAEWQYFENGRLDRIGYDTTGSGRVDKWERNPESADSSPPVVQDSATPAPLPAAAAEAAAAASAAASAAAGTSKPASKK
jgi:hypothetical protein